MFFTVAIVGVDTITGGLRVGYAFRFTAEFGSQPAPPSGPRTAARCPRTERGGG